MYSANFFERDEPSNEAEMHNRRLAFAFDIDRANRVLESTSSGRAANAARSAGSPVRQTASSPISWQDNQWLRPGHASLLDAPALRDDYYCSLLAYSYTAKCLAVGLGSQIYLWSESCGVNTPESLTAPFAGHVTSLSFSSTEGGHAILAIGRGDGRITLWSPYDRDPRFDSDQPAPVSCVAFAPRPMNRTSLRDAACQASVELLLIGDEAGHVYVYSVEWPTQEQRDLFDWHGAMTLLARIATHSQQICGMAWARAADFFATGANDNCLFLFNTKKILSPRHAAAAAAFDRGTTAPTVQIHASVNSASSSLVPAQLAVLPIGPGRETHRWMLSAAVKALAFSPWQSTLLAAGGGSNDRAIHFYHTTSGATLATIACDAQVTSLVWSQTRREIAATFGFAQPDHPVRVAVFAWPSCAILVKIPWWGEERALCAVAYPGGPGGLGLAGDDTVRGDDARRAAGTYRDGGTWFGRRTRDEGCLVVATSDASIKFHEVWSESSRSGGVGAGLGGSLGGSDILEAMHGVDKEGVEVIR